MVSGKDGSTDLILLKDLKELNPVKVAEYAVSNKIAEDLSFLGGYKICYVVANAVWRRMSRRSLV